MPKPIFIHIPKTSGSSIRTLINQNYKDTQVLSLYGDPKEILVLSESQIRKVKQYNLIQGHIPYGTHRFLGIKKPRYFTFLREPVARFLSDIAHAIRDAEHGFHHVLASPELNQKERISKALNISYYRNNMTQYVSGAFHTEEISMSQLGVAIDNLWSSDFVGLTEQFETSLLIMAKKLGWQHIVPQKCNVRPDHENPIDPQTRKKLKRALAYDVMLYAVAQEHLAKKIKKYGGLLNEAAAQLTEIIQTQTTEHPQAKFTKYLVGQAPIVPLDQYQNRIKKGSPLYRWTHV